MQSIEITLSDIESAIKEKIITKEQWLYLWKHFAIGSNQKLPSSSYLNVLYYIGWSITFIALSYLLWISWTVYGNWIALFIVSFYIVITFLWAEFLKRKWYWIPTMILVTIWIFLIPLVIDIIFEAFNYKNEQLLRFTQELWAFSWAIISFIRYKNPFLILPISFIVWFFCVDISEHFYPYIDNLGKYVSIFLWLCLIILSSIFLKDKTNKGNDYWNWLAISGSFIFWVTSSILYYYSIFYILINIWFLILWIMVSRNIFLFFGWVGLIWYIGYLLSIVFEGSLLFPVILIWVGLWMILTAIYYKKIKHIAVQSIKKFRL